MNSIREAAAGVGLSNIHEIVDLWQAGKADSLIDATRVTRVEPIVIVDSAVMFNDLTPEVMQSLLSTFAGFYLQAAALSITVGKINVIRHLDRLNPSRNPVDSAAYGIASAAGLMMARENYRFRLPRLGDEIAMESAVDYDVLPLKLPSPMEVALESIALEAMSRDDLNEAKYNLDVDKFAHQTTQDALRNRREDTRNRRENARDRYQRARDTAQDEFRNRQQSSADARDAAQRAHQSSQLKHQKETAAAQQANAARQNERGERELALREAQYADAQTASNFGIGRDTIQTVKELSNLSVGKLLSVDITDGNHSASIPVAVRLMAASLPSQTVAHILSLGKKDTSVKARWHGWRSGRLEFWKDLVLCNDLIDEHRNALMRDKDGLYRQIVARKAKNRFAGILSGNPSVATASNMAVIAKSTADQIELETVGNLNDFRVRQKLFEPTSLMILVVINPDYDRATFYYRGIAEKTEVSMRDLKAANKGSGPDVADILRAFTQGHAPSL